MHITFFAPRYHTNQIPIVAYLLEQKHKVHFVVSRKANTEDYTLIEPIVCKESFLSKLMASFLYRKLDENQKENRIINNYIPSVRWLISYFRSKKPDVVITRDTSFFSIIVYLVCKMLFIDNCILYTQEPVYINSNIDKMSFKRRIVRRFLLPAKEFSPVLVSNSSFNFQECNKSRREFIPFAMSFNNAVKNRTYYLNNKINILDIGKYRPYKDHFVLLKALSLLSTDELAKIHVSIVGQAKNKEEVEYKNRMWDYIECNGLENSITMYENIPFKDMENVYLTHDVFILPSKRETASISILESMAHGLVTISSDNNGTATYVNKNFGYIFQHENAESLVSILRNVIENRDKICDMGRQSFFYAQKEYSAVQYLDGLKKLL